MKNVKIHIKDLSNCEYGYKRKYGDCVGTSQIYYYTSLGIFDQVGYHRNLTYIEIVKQYVRHSETLPIKFQYIYKILNAWSSQQRSLYKKLMSGLGSYFLEKATTSSCITFHLEVILHVI
jgi:hypothetical protein